MPPPNNTNDLPQGVYITRSAGKLVLSDNLVELLVTARNGYDWPSGTGANISQQTILDLLGLVAMRITRLNEHDAHAIVKDVSTWAGNNQRAQLDIDNATPSQKMEMQRAILKLIVSGQVSDSINCLCNLPGISLVIASKIVRFCVTHEGAALDRHASYFFNSLPMLDQGMASHFIREWGNGAHKSSRLATYTDLNYRLNRSEYVDFYLHLLKLMACELNSIPALYTCASANQEKQWAPADVEMAAYYWWACNGSR